MLMVSLAGPQRRWMAAIFVHTDVPPERNKHPDIAEDNSLGRSRGRGHQNPSDDRRKRSAIKLCIESRTGP